MKYCTQQINNLSSWLTGIFILKRANDNVEINKCLVQGKMLNKRGRQVYLAESMDAKWHQRTTCIQSTLKSSPFFMIILDFLHKTKRNLLFYVTLGFLRQPSWACYSLIWIIMVQHKNTMCNLIHCLLLAEVTNHVTSVQSKLLAGNYRLKHVSEEGIIFIAQARKVQSAWGQVQ